MGPTNLLVKRSLGHIPPVTSQTGFLKFSNMDRLRALQLLSPTSLSMNNSVCKSEFSFPNLQQGVKTNGATPSTLRSVIFTVSIQFHPSEALPSTKCWGMNTTEPGPWPLVTRTAFPLLLLETSSERPSPQVCLPTFCSRPLSVFQGG
jgi:hypothetical protein